MKLKKLNLNFSVCKISDLKDLDLTQEFTFLSKTDEEISLVCENSSIPKNVTDIEHGWLGLKIVGPLDFSLIGIISKISTLLANSDISVFVISTFNTDYIFLKDFNFEKAITILENNGYIIV